MKKSFLLLLLLAGSLTVSAQFKLDAADFGSKFKTLFEAAKKRWATEKTGAKSTISEGSFVGQYGATTSFNGAEYSRIVVDGDGIHGHDTRFKIGSSKDEAKKILAEMTALIKANLPAKFIIRDTYEPDYLDGQGTVIEFDSEVFAQQAKQPSAKIGLKSINGTFMVDLTIFEPIFK